jgi:hypothetical protein
VRLSSGSDGALRLTLRPGVIYPRVCVCVCGSDRTRVVGTRPSFSYVECDRGHRFKAAHA